MKLIPEVTFNVACDDPAGVGTVEAISDIIAERQRQVLKWGSQQHFDGIGDPQPLRETDINLDLRSAAELERIFIERCDRRAERGEGTWLDILLEEVFEAAATLSTKDLRKELVQVAAVASAWIEDIDTRV